MFEILAVLSCLVVMALVTWVQGEMMKSLESLGFILSAWIVTGWGVLTILGGSLFLIDIWRAVCSI